ncbi:glyceraldehyde-3-phosphate dehydrogenase, testis-specific-like [Ananas comosus]|uniref:Glyceraldehyde-3-phosphate dehydrogenase, testis-specific-like n=1 Tax=Ananas comosus TaxID=4615 RepID=A0A6P5G6X4_ANACO|nr:glyceraldehyde-3-phosphate dehydrogenase, testis-specific-like [Ananas comosus]
MPVSHPPQPPPLRPPSPPPPPPPRLLLLRSCCLPRASFPFAAAASPASSFPFAATASHAYSPFPSPPPPPPHPPSPSQPPPPPCRRGRGGDGGVAVHGNPAWAEVGALARRGALNARRAKRTALPEAAADPGEQGEREGGIYMARVGSVVVTSVHQPSRCVLGLVDRLLILSRGHAAYCGDPHRLADFLAAFGCPIPAGETPAEFALDAVRSSSPAHRRRSPSSTPLPLKDAITASISRGKLVDGGAGEAAAAVKEGAGEAVAADGRPASWS